MRFQVAVATALLTLLMIPALSLGQTGGDGKYEVVTPGKGIDGITVGETKIESVIEKLGDAYRLIPHNGYSDEFNFESLGVAFWVCQKDPSKVVFSMEFRSPYRVETKEGFRIGETTLGEVIEKSGEPTMLSYNNSYGYDGILFHYDDWYATNKLTDKQKKERKIVSIHIVSGDGTSPCNRFDQESETEKFISLGSPDHF